MRYANTLPEAAAHASIFPLQDQQSGARLLFCKELLRRLGIAEGRAGPCGSTACTASDRPKFAAASGSAGGLMLETAKEWARTIKRDVVAIWIAARDPRVPWHAKALALAVAAYALSPIDLIPDFIPVLGYLDDLIIVPLGIMLVIKLIPAGLMTEFRAEAARREGRPTSRLGAAIIVLIWISAAGLLTWWLWPWSAN